jgi:uncharacterized protein (TIGR02001 family)
MNRYLLPSLLTAAIVLPLLPAMAHAQLSANLSLTSKYKYRGQDQSDSTKGLLPAVQGGFDYALGDFYVGNWNSSVGNAAGGTEVDVYGGYKFNFSGIALDTGLLAYLYPGSSNSNTTEVYIGGSLGAYGLKYSHTVSSRYFGETRGRGTGYLGFTANPAIGSGLVLNTAFGYTLKKSTDANTPDYADWKLGATYDLGSGFSAAAAVVGATKKKTYGDTNKSRVVFTITKSM